MILPEGNSKKYIKVVIGIYVLFTIVSPVISKISGKEIKLSDFLDIEEYIQDAETSAEVQQKMESQTEDSILNIYIDGLKNDMKAKIESKGYKVNNIEISLLNDENYEIQEIQLDLEKNSLENLQETNNSELENKIVSIENVKINNINSTKKSENTKERQLNNEREELSMVEKQELIKYLSEVYEVDTGNIKIN